MSALQRWFGVELDEVSLKEKLISGAGGFVGILLVIVVSRDVLGLEGAAMLIASMGASAVLVFAVPHGQLAQPWPVIGGHVVSALVGVTTAKLVDRVELAAAIAVGLAIVAMHLLKCIHPPGGATALSAVIGGPAVKALGFGFVFRPVMLGAVLLVAVGVAFNWSFEWRRYPVGIAPHRSRPGVPEPSHAEVLAALRSIDSFVDVSEDDLVRLVQLLAPQGATPAHGAPSEPSGDDSSPAG